MVLAFYEFTYTLETPVLMPEMYSRRRGDLLVETIRYQLGTREHFTYLGRLTTKSGEARANSSSNHYADPPVEDRPHYERLVRHAFRQYLTEGLRLVDAAEATARSES